MPVRDTLRLWEKEECLLYSRGASKNSWISWLLGKLKSHQRLSL